MNNDPIILRVKQNLEVCQSHADALKDAQEDLERRPPLGQEDLVEISKDLRRILDQFAYRYTRLQDDMGSRLLPSILQASGEEITKLSNIDRLNRLEQLEWLTSANEWLGLRGIRNEFTHDYPESAEEKLQRLNAGFQAAKRLTEILDAIKKKLLKNILTSA